MRTYRLDYVQTPHERYETDVNANAEREILHSNLNLVGQAGGAGFSADPDELIADQSFYVTGTREDVASMAITLTEIVGRPVAWSEDD